MERSNLYFDWGPALSHNKLWNFMIGSRGSGKTVASIFLLWNAWKKEGRPSIILRRRVVDITEAYITSIEGVLNKFGEDVQIMPRRSSYGEGVVDLVIGEKGVAYTYKDRDSLPVVFRVIGLSSSMQRIKSLFLKNAKWIFFDEFIIKPPEEKYLKDEDFKIKEIITTYTRESETPIRFIACGNPYSLHNPLFVDLKIPIAHLKAGVFLRGDNWTVTYFQPGEELQQKIWEENPLLHYDEDYAAYSFEGVPILDQNIRIEKFHPKGFKLRYVFRVRNKLLGVYRGDYNEEEAYGWWVCVHNIDWLDKLGKRTVFVLNLEDMFLGAIKLSVEQSAELFHYKVAMNRNQVKYNNINAYYLMKEVYYAI